MWLHHFLWNITITLPISISYYTPLKRTEKSTFSLRSGLFALHRIKLEISIYWGPQSYWYSVILDDLVKEVCGCPVAINWVSQKFLRFNSGNNLLKFYRLFRNTNFQSQLKSFYQTRVCHGRSPPAAIRQLANAVKLSHSETKIVNVTVCTFVFRNFRQGLNSNIQQTRWLQTLVNRFLAGSSQLIVKELVHISIEWRNKTLFHQLFAGTLKVEYCALVTVISV